MQFLRKKKNYRIRIRIVLFCHIQHSITMVMYKKNEIINAGMEAPIKTNYWSLS